MSQTQNFLKLECSCASSGPKSDLMPKAESYLSPNFVLIRSLEEQVVILEERNAQGGALNLLKPYIQQLWYLETLGSKSLNVHKA